MPGGFVNIWVWYQLHVHYTEYREDLLDFHIIKCLIMSEHHWIAL